MEKQVETALVTQTTGQVACMTCATCADSGKPKPTAVQNGWAGGTFQPETYNAGRAYQHYSESDTPYIALTIGDIVRVDMCDSGWAHGWVNGRGPGWFPHGYVRMYRPCATCAAFGEPKKDAVHNCWACWNFQPETYNPGALGQPCCDSEPVYIPLTIGDMVIVSMCDIGWAHGWVNSRGPGWFPHGFVRMYRPCATCVASGNPGLASIQNGWAGENFRPAIYNAGPVHQPPSERDTPYIALNIGDAVRVNMCDSGWAHSWVNSRGPGWFPHGFIRLHWHLAEPSSPPAVQPQLQLAHDHSVDVQASLACLR